MNRKQQKAYWAKRNLTPAQYRIQLEHLERVKNLQMDWQKNMIKNGQYEKMARETNETIHGIMEQLQPSGKFFI